MSGAEVETEESGWTKANLQKLLAGMKASIPEQERMSIYNKGLKSVDWNQVAFPPFSPEACQQKCRDILQKMRKIRTLTELIVEAEEVVSNPDHNRQIHPEFPKRPSPPNAIYYEENWAKFHKQHPKLSLPELLKFVAKKYKGLPEKEKAQYVEKFNAATAEYEKRMLKFSQQYDKPVHKTYRKRKKVSVHTSHQGKKEKGLPPKPPANGYNLFCKEQIMCMKGVSRNAYVSVWAQRWRELSETQRDSYTTRCRELKREYVVQLNEYLEMFDKNDHQRILSENGIKIPKIGKKKARKVKKLPGEPKMPSQSGNVIFCQTQMKLLKEKIPNSKKCFTEVNKMWRTLSENEKKPYQEKVHEKMREYSKKLQKWFKTLTLAEKKDYCMNNPNKCQYLDADQIKAYTGDPCLHVPSDSEDTYMEESSSDEEEIQLDCDEDEEEEEEDDDVIMFDMY